MLQIRSNDELNLIFQEIEKIIRPALINNNFNSQEFINSHSQKIKNYIESKKTIQFLLPAFPMKSPNRFKVLGKLPDLAEELSLGFLNQFCEKISEHYAPGAELIICSDGRVFGDVIGVQDEDITSYQNELRKIIQKINAKHISVINLEDFSEFQKISFTEMREMLVNKYAQSVSEIKADLLSNENGLNLYRAMSRFLFEDTFTPEYQGSKNALQQISKKRAIETIQRSWAWGSLLEVKFPEALRLSIHPQPDSSSKIGIHMMPTQDNWLTPWHGVAARINDQFLLMKKSEALSLNGTIIMNNGRPSFFEIPKSPEAKIFLENIKARNSGTNFRSFRNEC